MTDQSTISQLNPILVLADADLLLADQSQGDGTYVTKKITSANVSAKFSADAGAAASGYADAAAASAATAATSETNAAASATTATTKAGVATTKAGDAASSAAAAAISETNAATSETNAATSETNAAASKTAAAVSEANAAASAALATVTGANLFGRGPVASIITALPGSPSDGDRYLVAHSDTTGDLVGKEDQVVERTSGAWVYSGTPQTNQSLVLGVYQYVFDSTWQATAVIAPAPRGGSLDDATALNAILVAAASIGVPVRLGGLTYKVNSTLSVDLAKVLLDLEGGTLDFSELDASPAIAPFTSEADPNKHVAAHRAHPIRNGTIIGPGSDSGFSCFTPVAVTFSDTPWFAGITYENINTRGFAVMHDIVAGDFFLNMTNCSMCSVTGVASGWVLRSVGATNAGENMQITNFILTNADGFYLEDAGNGNMDINVNNASIDGCTYIATGGTLAAPGTAAALAQIKMFGGHWEMLTYTDYAIWCSASFMGWGVDQVLSGTLSHVPFKCDATGLAPGIVLRDHTFVTDGTAAFPGGRICDGSGRFVLEQKGAGSTYVFCGALASNRVPSYTFPTSDSLTTNWLLSAQYDATDKPTGATASCKLDGSHTTSVFKTPCLPGQSVAAQVKVKIADADPGDSVSVYVSYKDGAGNDLSTGATTAIDSADDYTDVQAIATTVAPPGTVSAALVVAYSQFAGPATVNFGLPEVQIM